MESSRLSVLWFSSCPALQRPHSHPAPQTWPAPALEYACLREYQRVSRATSLSRGPQLWMVSLESHWWPPWTSTRGRGMTGGPWACCRQPLTTPGWSRYSGDWLEPPSPQYPGSCPPPCPSRTCKGSTQTALCPHNSPPRH